MKKGECSAPLWSLDFLSKLRQGQIVYAFVLILFVVRFMKVAYLTTKTFQIKPCTICSSHHVQIQRGDRGSGPPPPPPAGSYKNIGFLSNTGPDPIKSQSYQSSFRCWAIIGLPLKRHLNGVRWRAVNGLLIVLFGSFLPSSN